LQQFAQFLIDDYNYVTIDVANVSPQNLDPADYQFEIFDSFKFYGVVSDALQFRDFDYRQHTLELARLLGFNKSRLTHQSALAALLGVSATGFDPDNYVAEIWDLLVAHDSNVYLVEVEDFHQFLPELGDVLGLGGEFQPDNLAHVQALLASFENSPHKGLLEYALEPLFVTTAHRARMF
jgi:hypothetical protein